MNRISTLGAITALALAGTPAIAQPDHIFLSEEDGALRTDLWVDNDPNQKGPPNADGGDITPNVRAFAEQMGGIPGFGPQDPGQTIHPGLFGDIPGVTVGFNIIDAMRVWDGSDFDEVSGDDADELRMQVAGFTTPAGDDPLNPDVFLTPTAPGQFVPGDDEWITAGSIVDEHLQFTLTDDAGNLLTPDQADAVSDIFLVTIEFTSTTLSGTEPIFLTLGQNVSDAELADAQRFVEDVLVPAPGSAAVLAGLGLMAARRRR